MKPEVGLTPVSDAGGVFHHAAVPDVVYTDPQAAAVGATEAAFSATGAARRHP